MRALVKNAPSPYKEFYQLPLAAGIIGVFGCKDGHAELTGIKFIPVQAQPKITVPAIKVVKESEK